MIEGLDRTPLTRDFFDRPVLEVAPDLLGRTLVRITGDGPIELRLTEVEAYAGEIDPRLARLPWPHGAQQRDVRTTRPRLRLLHLRMSRQSA
jgi:3-methyladenine DNA glycosylase Mpg